MLPTHQVCKGETGAAQLPVEPDTEGVQRELRRQAGQKAGQIMRTLTTEAEGMMPLVIDRLDDLAHPSQPPAHTLGPGVLTMAFWRTHDVCPIAIPPAPVRGLAFEALLTDRGPQRGLPDAQAAGVWLPTPRKEGLGQRLILGTGGGQPHPRPDRPLAARGDPPG